MPPSANSRRLTRRYWDANQISIIALSVITLIAVLGIIVCMVTGKGNVGTLDTIVAGGMGALAMYVRPLPPPNQKEGQNDAEPAR